MIKHDIAKFTNPQGGAAIKVHVDIEAKQTRVKSVDEKGGLVTIDLACQKGEINQVLLSFLQDLLHVEDGAIEILDGAKKADKVICVLGASVEEINEILKEAY